MKGKPKKKPTLENLINQYTDTRDGHPSKKLLLAIIKKLKPEFKG